MTSPMIKIGTGVAIALMATAADADDYVKFRLEHFGGLARNYFLTLNAPAGTLTVEANPAAKVPDNGAPPAEATADRPSYNRTLASDHFSRLDQINTANVGQLEVVCTYDTGEIVAFESGVIVVEGAMIGTTEFDMFSIDPATCKENWRTHESLPPGQLSVNHGTAYLDGRLFRGTQDGRVLAYNFRIRKRLWEATIADPERGETVPSAPIVWDGLVYVGNAGGDYKGAKGRMYALDAETGKIV